MFNYIKSILKMCDWVTDDLGDEDFDFYIGSPYTPHWDYYVFYSRNEKEIVLKAYSDRVFHVEFKTSSIEEFDKYVINVIAEVERKHAHV